jgi:hypothetical protein
MMVIHGIDRFGRIESGGGEYLVTRFHHLFLVPIIPIGSEWITENDGTRLLGRPCRLSWRSVLTAYARAWGVIAAAALVLWIAALGGGPIALGVAAIAVYVGRMYWRRPLRDRRELRRIELQRPVFGIALDPRQLRRADALLLLPAAEAGFAEVSGGRTALDVARTGASSEAQAAHAFVVLRLMAACERRARAAELVAASDRLLEPDELARARRLLYREPDEPPVPPRSPLMYGALLRPHRWYGLTATIGLWVVTCASMLPSPTKCFCSSKEEIAYAGARKLATEAFGMWTGRHPDTCPTVDELAEIAGTARDPWGTPYHLRCGRDADGTLTIAVWSAGPDKLDGGGHGDDIVPRD